VGLFYHKHPLSKALTYQPGFVAGLFFALKKEAILTGIASFITHGN